MDFTLRDVFTICGFVVTGVTVFVTQKNNTANNTKEIAEMDNKLIKIKHSYDKVLFSEKGEHNYVSVRIFEKYLEAQDNMAQLVQSIDKRLAVISAFLEMKSKESELKGRRIDTIHGKED